MRLRPAALRIEARRMMERPIMKATTGFNELDGCSCLGIDVPIRRMESHRVDETVGNIVLTWESHATRGS